MDDQEKSEANPSTPSLPERPSEGDPEYSRQMEAARRIMKEYEDTLRRLAES